MKIKHNKKRNVGLLFEQLNNILSESIVKEDKQKVKLCVDIINESFSRDLELYKELRLFRALSVADIKNESTINNIINKTKNYLVKFDSDKLSKEKTQLIKRLNEAFGKDYIYSIPVNNFKSLATIQILLNEWRKNIDSDIVVQLEDKLVTEIKSRNSKPLLEEKNEQKNINNFVLNLAKQKFLEKYKSLSNEQLKMLFEYTVVKNNQENYKNLIKKYEIKKNNAIKSIEKYLATEGKNESSYFKQKLNEAKQKLNEFVFSNEIPNETCIKRALSIQKLLEEIN